MTGTLDYEELETLLKVIDSKLTSLPATAQRAHQQGLFPPMTRLILELISPRN
jgi:hypothetical protein